MVTKMAFTWFVINAKMYPRHVLQRHLKQMVRAVPSVLFTCDSQERRYVGPHVLTTIPTGVNEFRVTTLRFKNEELYCTCFE